MRKGMHRVDYMLFNWVYLGAGERRDRREGSGVVLFFFFFGGVG